MTRKFKIKIKIKNFSQLVWKMLRRTASSLLPLISQNAQWGNCNGCACSVERSFSSF